MYVSVQMLIQLRSFDNATVYFKVLTIVELI